MYKGVIHLKGRYNRIYRPFLFVGGEDKEVEVEFTWLKDWDVLLDCSWKCTSERLSTSQIPSRKSLMRIDTALLLDEYWFSVWLVSSLSLFYFLFLAELLSSMVVYTRCTSCDVTPSVGWKHSYSQIVLIWNSMIYSFWIIALFSQGFECINWS